MSAEPSPEDIIAAVDTIASCLETRGVTVMQACLKSVRDWAQFKIDGRSFVRARPGSVYRKRSESVSALRWTGFNYSEMFEFVDFDKPGEGVFWEPSISPLVGCRDRDGTFEWKELDSDNCWIVRWSDGRLSVFSNKRFVEQFEPSPYESLWDER